MRSIRITGVTVYDSEALEPLYQHMLGHEVSLDEIYKLARRVTAKYGHDGYVLSRAIVPPQRLNPEGATVEIQVIEGYVDRVEWPTAISRYRDFFSDYAAKITAERPINIRTIERYLLLAGDLPGLRFTSTLRPSASQVGASTLVVEVTEKRFDWQMRSDNRGTEARGPYQGIASVAANNLVGGHEALGVTWAAASEVSELQYLAASYRHVLTSEGLTLLVNASHSWGDPGTEELELFEFATDSSTLEAGLSYPVIRLRERNLSIAGVVFGSDSESDIFDETFNQDRLRGIRLGLEADAADEWAAINQFTLRVSQGIDGLGSTNNENPFASRGAGRVDFTKLEGSLSRLQPLGASFSILLAAYGQYAFDPLLSPEQCGFGGRTFGRAFDPSELIGDHCWELSGELRYDVPSGRSLFAHKQLYAFADHGKLYTMDAAVGTPDEVSGTSIGAGLRLGWRDRIDIDLSAAKAEEGPRDGWRFFLAVSSRY